MGKITGISWTDHTFNPWWGCTKVSPGCDHCFADAFDKRVGGNHWGKGVPRRTFGEKHWDEPLKWNKVAEDLARIGYDSQWSRLSACAFGATHMRQRVFIVAHPHSLNGRPRFRDSYARAFRPLQTFDGFESARAGSRLRLANPSELYRGADGITFGMDRNRGIGNMAYPQIAEWIGRRIVACHEQTL
jgi:hypothetical protein